MDIMIQIGGGDKSARTDHQMKDNGDEYALLGPATTFEKSPTLFEKNDDHDQRKKSVDVSRANAQERPTFIENFMTKHIENDNLRLLQKIRSRIDRVDVKLPTLEVRYKNLSVEAECQVVHGKPLPTLWNSLKSELFDLAKVFGYRINRANISIINDVSGVIKPGRMTLLLGPPGCGKTSLLKALSGNLNQSLKVTGEVLYNGYKLEEFVPQKTSAYVSQYDLHIPEMTVRETLDFSACCQGVGSQADIMLEVSRREKQAGIVPNPVVDKYMKATSVKGLKESIRTDYILKILGLDICADTLVGDSMRRGISGGQKKRLTTGEMIVGPIQAFLMDEITNGLDIATAFQIITCLQQFVHIADATILVSLLQPSPETFNLFDDIIVMAEGKIIYHGPRERVLEFFESCGFTCPGRKAVADFLQEVISRKDQEQFWYNTQHSYKYVSVDMFSRKFKESPLGKKLCEEVSELYDKTKSCKNGLSFTAYSLSRWELFRACLSRELLLLRRNSFVHIFKTVQITVIAIITMTVFLRSQMDIDVSHANYYMGALFFALVILLVDGMPELSMTVARLAIFYKQKELCFYPAWAYVIPATILKIPISLVVSSVWTSLTYYVIGYSPEVWRFFCQFILLFALHFTSTSMFQLLASVFQTEASSMTAGSFTVLLVLLFGGFIIPHPSMPVWLKWGFWVSPLTYGEIGMSMNEFLAPRWQKILSTNTTIGQAVLNSRGLNFDGYYFWISVGALFMLAIVFNIGFALALSFFKAPESSHTMISHEMVAKKEQSRKTPNANEQSCKGAMILPFQPLTVVFQDLRYYVDAPQQMRGQAFGEKKLQLLSDITGALRPGVLTALMGVSGAGKTTLLDILAGRKTSSYVEGEIKIGGYLKVQETFARVSGYCEQTDIHSPQITVKESIMFSAWLRLAPEIDSKTKTEFVNEVLETIELDGIKDTLVGIPGVSGLSTEQRKRLTIAVELVANPSIIFMDEPTTGLDAQAAAIVMRAVKNVADTGRTTVCTIHQPSIAIFEAFDELILLKTGGRIIYSGPLGKNPSRVIEYFEGISGVPKIRNGYNPATWILEVTSTSAEAELGVEFSQIYMNSPRYKYNTELVRQLSASPPGSRDLHFPTRYSQNVWEQFKSCLWKQHLSYWRSPTYNLTRIKHTLAASLLFGILFWNQGQKINNQQNFFNIVGALFVSVTFLGINNCSSVLSYVSMERNIMYREKFAAMYSPWTYALAQVTIEIPYILVQAVAYVIITYPMIGYYGSACKVLWNFYGMFCTMLYFNYLGMFLVSLTPNFTIAAILFSAMYTIFNLFAGFLIPQPQIPKWWIWLYYMAPTSWTLNVMLTSQYGDLDHEISVFGETKTLATFLHDYFGFHHDQLDTAAAVLIAFPLAFAFLFAFCVKQLNFQRR